MPAAAVAQGQSKPPSEALERFRLGEISVDEFLDAKVEQALALVASTLSVAQLELVREVLRDEIRMDPGFVELVRRTTGADIDAEHA